MRVSRTAALLLAGVAMVGLSGIAHADSITLDNADNQSVLETDAQDFPAQAGPVQTILDVNSLPLDTTGSPTIASQGTSRASLRSTLTTSGFNLNYGETLGEDPGDASGDADIFFTAGLGVSYSLSGSQNSGGEDYLAELTVFLFDETTNTFVYLYDQSQFADGPSTLTLDSSTTDAETIGALNGALTAGDIYEFLAKESFNNSSDPSSNGNVTISFSPSVAATPLPRSGMAGLVLMGLVGAAKARRRTLSL